MSSSDLFSFKLLFLRIPSTSALEAQTYDPERAIRLEQHASKRTLPKFIELVRTAAGKAGSKMVEPGSKIGEFFISCQ